MSRDHRAEEEFNLPPLDNTRDAADEALERIENKLRTCEAAAKALQATVESEVRFAERLQRTLKLAAQVLAAHGTVEATAWIDMRRQALNLIRALGIQP